MKRTSRILMIFLIGIYSCEDILEEDITNDSITIISPMEGATIEVNIVQFNWNELEGADDYRIQIIRSQNTIIDSTVSSSNFSFPLNPGSYQWRVKGENFAYQTPYTFPVSFTVEMTEDLTNQTVILQTPSSNIYTNYPELVFTWTPITSVDSYTLEIIKVSTGEETILQETNITDINFSVDASTFTDDAEYKWRVKGVNSTSETSFSARTFFVDRIAPNQPTLITPNEQEVTDDIVDFSWSNGTDQGGFQSMIINTIEISSDIDFNTIVHTDSTEDNTYQYVFTNSGNYYWRIIAMDLANNQSEYSDVRTFTVE